MKRLIVTLCAATLGLSACGGGDTPEAFPPTATTTVTATATASAEPPPAETVTVTASGEAAPAETITQTVEATVTETVEAAAVTETVTETATEAAAEPAAPPEASSEDTIMNGIWTVGRDVEPGSYRTSEAVSSGFCYWSITVTGSNGSDIVNNAIVEGGVPNVTLEEGQDSRPPTAGPGSARSSGHLRED